MVLADFMDCGDYGPEADHPFEEAESKGAPRSELKSAKYSKQGSKHQQKRYEQIRK
jgi:hypothetical protein